MTFPSSDALPQIWTKVPRISTFQFGNINLIPFDKSLMIGHFQMEFHYLLGLTNPCPTAVDMEPFSTSVFSSHLNICYYQHDLH